MSLLQFRRSWNFLASFRSRIHFAAVLVRAAHARGGKDGPSVSEPPTLIGLIMKRTFSPIPLGRLLHEFYAAEQLSPSLLRSGAIIVIHTPS